MFGGKIETTRHKVVKQILEGPRIRVHCSVDNCQYNKGHRCYAHTLEVNASGDGHAHTSDGTRCSTFVPR